MKKIKVNRPQTAISYQLSAISNKKWLVILILLLTTHYSLLPTQGFSQVSINENGAAPANSAMLDVNSNSKGVLINRMHTNEYPNPAAEGLLIFDLDKNCFMSYVNGTWKSVACPAPCQPPDAPTTAGAQTINGSNLVWRWNTVSGAVKYEWSLTPDISTATLATPANAVTYSMPGFTQGNSYILYVWAVNGCGAASAMASFPSCYPYFVHTDIGINGAPETTDITYPVVLTDKAGTGVKCWIAQNLGASVQASCGVDSREAAAGWYYKYDNPQGWAYHSGTITPTGWSTSTPGNDPTWITSNDPCNKILGTGWRIPTEAEWLSLGVYFNNPHNDNLVGNCPYTNFPAHTGGNIAWVYEHEPTNLKLFCSGFIISGGVAGCLGPGQWLVCKDYYSSPCSIQPMIALWTSKSFRRTDIRVSNGDGTNSPQGNTNDSYGVRCVKD